MLGSAERRKPRLISVWITQLNQSLSCSSNFEQQFLCSPDVGMTFILYAS